MTIMRKTRRVGDMVLFGHDGEQPRLGYIAEIDTTSYRVEQIMHMGDSHYPGGTIWWVSKHLVRADVNISPETLRPRTPSLDMNDPKRHTTKTDVIFLGHLNKRMQGRIIRINKTTCTVQPLQQKATLLIHPSRITPIY